MRHKKRGNEKWLKRKDRWSEGWRGGELHCRYSCRRRGPLSGWRRCTARHPDTVMKVKTSLNRHKNKARKAMEGGKWMVRKVKRRLSVKTQQKEAVKWMLKLHRRKEQQTLKVTLFELMLYIMLYTCVWISACKKKQNALLTVQTLRTFALRETSQNQQKQSTFSTESHQCGYAQKIKM